MHLDDYIHRKWRTLFRYMNHSGNGEFTMEELMFFPSQLIKTGKVELGVLLAKVYREHWDRVFRAVNRTPDKLYISEEDWVRGQTIVSQDKEFYTEFINVVSVAFFDLMDRNKDGVICIEEWRRYYQAQGPHSESFIQRTFAKMDCNGDGYISREEFENAMLTYNFKHAPGNDFSFLYDSK